MCERLAIAMDRLSVRGLRADQWRQEITSIANDLFPGRAVSVTPMSHGDFPPSASGEGVDLWDGESGLLRVSVGAELSAEQLAALRLLEALATGGATIRAVREVEPVDEPRLPHFIAAAQATRALKREIAQLSRSSATILITGESGSGKEIVARGVH